MYLKVIGDCNNHFNKPMSLPHKNVSTKQCGVYASPMSNTVLLLPPSTQRVITYKKKKVHGSSVAFLAANEYFCNAFYPSLTQIHTNSGWQAHSRCCCRRQHTAIAAGRSMPIPSPKGDLLGDRCLR